MERVANHFELTQIVESSQMDSTPPFDEQIELVEIRGFWVAVAREKLKSHRLVKRGRRDPQRASTKHPRARAPRDPARARIIVTRAKLSGREIAVAAVMSQPMPGMSQTTHGTGAKKIAEESGPTARKTTHAAQALAVGRSCSRGPSWTRASVFPLIPFR